MFRQSCFQNPRPPNFNVDAFLFFGLRGPLICFVPSPGVPNDAQHWNWGDRGTHFEYPLILLSIYSLWGRQNSWAKHLQMFLLQHLSPTHSKSNEASKIAHMNDNRFILGSQTHVCVCMCLCRFFLRMLSCSRKLEIYGLLKKQQQVPPVPDCKAQLGPN